MLRTLFWRFAVPVLVALSVGAWIAVPYVERMLTEWFRTDVDMRAKVVMSSMGETLPTLLDRSELPRLRRFLSKVTEDERLLAVLACRPNGQAIHQTDRTPPQVSCALAALADEPASRVLRTPQGTIHLARYDVVAADGQPAVVILVHDMSFVDRRYTKARDYLIAFGVMSALVLALLSVAAAWLLLRRWGALLVRDIRSRRFLDDAEGHSSVPILSQVRKVLREIEHDQRLEIDYRENWTPNALAHVVRQSLDSPQMIVVSNREPYIHNRGADGRPVVQVPASGMVTALEPIIRACSGVWVAHGSGSADRDVVDLHDRVSVPPSDPAYTLRRVWLTEEEENGFYFGFSNEGLWPLCHLAYVRPSFREADWKQYQAVNRKFADVVLKEARTDHPVVFVQDYHFALLPSMVRQRIPGATIVVFWHIPWPNAETFGVCPWKEALLLGMLRADILGFHTRHHCQNFLETVDRYVECHIDRENMTVTIQGHVCQVAPYPISIEWPPRWLEQLPSAEQCARTVRERYHLDPDVRIGVGVERWDFTKGIVERFLAIEQLLESDPALRGKVSLLQVAAPTRGKLPAYRLLRQETEETAARINARFGTGHWKPIVLIGEHQEPLQVFELYRAADFCLVNSLHDGMNLVAKEFVAARDDHGGVLILSTFAGASRELIEALLVNPYDISETAAAIRMALRMDRDERRERMRLMRRTVKENNVYRWAGRMLMDAARVRQRQQLRSRTEARARESRDLAA
ncbi:MAG: trehalose-6-phosphate synthase [Burkholderiaceae bacterium]|nr:trehalose-6-phosphate synthase [Burkholderiales bacterium]MCZ8104215.1 trehalose-6-phosphate synthase [Burkholderiales bacterium]MCZ8339100.1 trehalose-6-phosphate synthase [Burkholderiaceae bacterium]